MKKLNKKGKIISGVVLVAIILGGGLWFNSKNTSNDNSNGSSNISSNNKSNSTKVESNAIEAPKKNSSKVEEISGFKENTNKKVGGLKLPYNVENTSLVIENIGQYTGPFVEDGSDTPTANVLSILVKNNSEQVIQYAEIKVKINNKKTVIFKVSNLKAKTSALVMESTGKVEYKEDDKYKVVDSLDATIDKMSMMDKQVAIVSSQDNKIKIKNISDKDLGTVYVYYKNIQNGGAYLGGITYRAKFENMKAGATVEAETSHFYKNGSEIVMVSNIDSK